MNVAGRKMRRIDLDVLQAGLQRFERGLDLAREFERVRLGLLLDDQQDARAVVDDRVADRRRRADLHVRHFPERDRRAAANVDHGLLADLRLREPATTCRTASRWFGVSTKPPPSSATASPAARVTMSSVTLFARKRSGFTST